MYPEDFANLHENKGMLFNIFNNKDKYIKDRLSNIENDVNNLQSKISAINNEHLKNLDEVRSLYIINAIGNINIIDFGYISNRAK